MVNRKSWRVQICHAPGELRRWQGRVVDRLAVEPGVTVGLVPVATSAAAPRGLDLLFAFERLFLGRDETTAADRIAPLGGAALDGRPDLVIDLAGGVTDSGVAVLRPTILGLPPLAGAAAAVIDGRVPVLELEVIGPGDARRTVGRWSVGVEDRRNTLRAVSQILGRLAHMVLAAVDGLRRDAGEGTLYLAEAATPARASAFAAAALFAHALETRIARKLDRSMRTPADWRVIWRRRDLTAPALAPHRDPTPFRLLPDDGGRFYADPFLWTEGDQTWLFVEEFPYATGRGILSVAEIGADGSVSTPRPILDQSCHLSYPQVFAEGGTIWMVPETSGRRTVELWRAVDFPDRWERHAVLLDDVDLGDATIERVGDTWWMFGTSREPWCSSWDALHVWHAPALTGPWTPVDGGPQVVDIATARPAGRMIATPSGLLRPVQDSSLDYGCGLGLTRVDRLDAGGFAETRIARFATPKPLDGLHTWNRAATPTGLVEAMDVFVRADDFGAERALDLTPERSTPEAAAFFET